MREWTQTSRFEFEMLQDLLEGITMKPLNRRLLIEVIEEDSHAGAFLVPKEETRSEFIIARVVGCADDCSADLTGQRVVLHAFGIEEVMVGGTQYVFVGESHLVGWDQEGGP